MAVTTKKTALEAALAIYDGESGGDDPFDAVIDVITMYRDKR
jgi:hypothetical protein